VLYKYRLVKRRGLAPGEASEHAIGWPRFLERLAEAGAGCDPGRIRGDHTAVTGGVDSVPGTRSATITQIDPGGVLPMSS